MKKNVGVTDRIIRFVFIDFLIGISYLGNDTIKEYGTIAFIIGLMLLFNVITGYSFLYRIMGLNTVETTKESSKNDLASEQ